MSGKDVMNSRICLFLSFVPVNIADVIRIFVGCIFSIPNNTVIYVYTIPQISLWLWLQQIISPSVRATDYFGRRVASLASSSLTVST
jgi:hypothetical protein